MDRKRVLTSYIFDKLPRAVLSSVLAIALCSGFSAPVAYADVLSAAQAVATADETSSSAVTVTQSGHDFTCTLDTTTYTATITGCTRTDATATAVDIPASVDYGGASYPVTAIADGALQGGEETVVHIPVSVTSIGANAFANSASLVAADLTACTTLTSIGTGAFQGCADGLTVYVATSTIADLLTALSTDTAGTLTGNVDATTAGVAIGNGGSFTDTATFSAGALCTDVEESGYTFVTWTSDAALMHPTTAWKTLSTGVRFYAKLSANSPVTDPVDYPGYQGLDQQMRLLDLSALPGQTVASGTSIKYYGDSNGYYDNRIVSSYAGDQRINFAFNIARGNAANGGDGSYQKSFTLPYVSILDSSGNTVASYDDGGGALKLFKIYFDGSATKTTGYTIYAFKIGVEADTLAAGTYTLCFDKDLGSNNGLSFLGKDVDFQFTVDYPQRYQLSYESDGAGGEQVTGITVDDGFQDLDVTIPATDDGLPVTSIGASALSDVTSVGSVTVPASVTSIGSGAFSGMTGLKWVKVLGKDPATPTWGQDVFGAAPSGLILYGYSVATTVAVEATSVAGATFVSIDDGVHVNGTLLSEGNYAASLTLTNPQAQVTIWANGTDVTSRFRGYISNTNVVTHPATASDTWNTLTAQANGTCSLEIRGTGACWPTIKLTSSGFSIDASTARTALSSYQGNGSTISLASVDVKGTDARVATATYDETLDYFDDYIEGGVCTTNALITLDLAGPGSAWEIARWDWDDWTTNHLNPYLHLYDTETDSEVASIGDGMNWVTLSDSNAISLRFDDDLLQDGKTYTLVADADLTGHNVAAPLSTAVHWTFTATSVTAMSALDVALANPTSTYTYTGSAFEPAVTVTQEIPGTDIWDTKSNTDVRTAGSTRSFILGTDYTVAYDKNINAGTGTITVSGTGTTCSGSTTVDFTIDPQAITQDGFTIDTTTKVGTGSAIEPSVTSPTLVAGVDYTIACTNNIDAGTATVTVTGIGNYTGSITKTFTIAPKSETTGTYGAIKYKVLTTSISGGTVTITAPANKSATSVTIPTSIKIAGLTYKVTSIAAKAFYKNTKITKLTVSSTVLTTIGAKAFYGCKNLKTIKFSSARITSVGSYAFKGIYARAKVYVPKSKVKAYAKLFRKGGLSSTATVRY